MQNAITTIHLCIYNSVKIKANSIIQEIDSSHFQMLKNIRIIH